MRMSRRAAVYSQGGKLWLYKSGDADNGQWLRYGLTVTYEADYLAVKISSTSNRHAYTAQAIDLTNYTTLYFDGYGGSNRRNAYANVSKTATGDMAAYVSMQVSQRSVISLDVSGLTGNYYIRITNRVYESGDVEGVRCYNYWLE